MNMEVGFPCVNPTYRRCDRTIPPKRKRLKRPPMPIVELSWLLIVKNSWNCWLNYPV